MGAAVSMIGAVGTDGHGDAMLATLRSDGIDVEGVARLAEHPTGTAHIAVAAGGENLIIVAGGANRQVPDDMVRAPSAHPAIRAAQLETPVSTLAGFFGCPEDGLTNILNAAPYMPEGRSLFNLCSIIIVNEVELAGYAERAIDEERLDDIAAAARSLITRERQHIIVTRGARGAVAIGKDIVAEASPFPASVVDTTGAGDCFCGALAAALAQGDELAVAMRRASAAAAIAVGRAGAIPSLPTAAEVDAFLAERA
jgi:ribokinase